MKSLTLAVTSFPAEDNGGGLLSIFSLTRADRAICEMSWTVSGRGKGRMMDNE